MTEYFWQRLQKFAARLRGEKPRALPAEYLARLKEQASIVCEFSKRKKIGE